MPLVGDLRNQMKRNYWRSLANLSKMEEEYIDKFEELRSYVMNQMPMIMNKSTPLFLLRD